MKNMRNDIELLGHFGAGKTTVKTLLLKENKNILIDSNKALHKSLIKTSSVKLRHRIIEVVYYLFRKKVIMPNYIIWDLISSFIFSNYDIWNNIIKLTSQDQNNTKKLLSQWMKFIVKYQLISHVDFKKTVVYDEGLLQKLASINFSFNEDNKKLVYSILHYFGYPKDLIIVSCNGQEALNRVLNRKRGLPVRFNELNSTDILKQIQHINNKVSYLIKMVENKTNIIRISNENFKDTLTTIQSLDILTKGRM